MCPIHVKSQSPRRDHHSPPSPHTHISLKSILDPCQHAVFAEIVGYARKQDGATSWRHTPTSPTHISKLKVDQGNERDTERMRVRERERQTDREAEKERERKKKWTRRKRETNTHTQREKGGDREGK